MSKGLKFIGRKFKRWQEGRKGGFLQRAGMAAAMLASASGQLMSSCQDVLMCLSMMEDDCEPQAFEMPTFMTDYGMLL